MNYNIKSYYKLKIQNLVLQNYYKIYIKYTSI